MSVTFLSDFVAGLNQKGRNLLLRNRFGRQQPLDPEALCEALVSRAGEVSCFMLSETILSHWEGLDEAGQADFLTMIAHRFGPDRKAIAKAIAAVEESDDAEALYRLHAASEPRSQELIRRLNHALQGTERLVRMREVLLRLARTDPALDTLDRDFAHLFGAWFNRGFLELKPIDWNTSAAILEKIIRYEAVHEIGGWNDLRRRIEPKDRRLFAFFHPQMQDEPLIFVEVALTDHIPGDIASLLSEDREVLAQEKATTAVFYSISNCQAGLRGISFGNFLIKQVVEKLRQELPNLRHFMTLSPVPGFAAWLNGLPAGESQRLLSAQNLERMRALAGPSLPDNDDARANLKPVLEGLAAYYLLEQRNARKRPLDSVARFHLGNGARLDNIHAFADLSAKGRKSGYSVMVNYLYDTREIEANHEAYAERGIVAASGTVKSLLKQFLFRTQAAAKSNPEPEAHHAL
ncbi:MAG: malonyl-CoA decarboxylase [Mesorhizobium sp.]